MPSRTSSTRTSAATDCTAECPVHRTAQIIDGKWTTQIVRDLLPGKKRYSQCLRLLESHGLLVKTTYAEVPPRTEYELTRLGLQLKGVIREMSRFGQALAER